MLCTSMYPLEHCLIINVTMLVLMCFRKKCGFVCDMDIVELDKVMLKCSKAFIRTHSGLF